MSLIEGIGDEVLHFFIALFVITMVMLAWRTTNIGDQWHVHTFYLLDRSIMRILRNHRRLTNHTEVTTISESTMTSSENNTTENADNVDTDTNLIQSDAEQEQSNIVETMDGERYTLRQRRIAAYDNRICNNDTHVENHSNTNLEECTANVDEKTTNNDNCEIRDTNVDNSTSTNIRIKLKYINDDLKLVEGQLEESLGDFKRRHFNEEISSNKFVKLIFNGQILERDHFTLQRCGLFDNCVVHCLIHPMRLSHDENRERSDTSRSNNNSNNNSSREWDLGNVLIALLSFILGTAWYFRYQYPHLFTVTATVALVAVTGVFTIISVGLYFPDPDPVRQDVQN